MAKKILSLDGGGSWALIQAIALKEIYSNTEVGTSCRKILNEFDLIAANSGGSLVLAAMIENADKDIDEVIKMFKTESIRSKVFSELRRGEKHPIEFIARLIGFGPKYKASRKIDGLLEALPKTGKINLHEINKEAGIKANIVICGFDYDRCRAVFFRSKEDTSVNNSNKEYEYTLADAVNAASNAPVNFFDEPVRFNYDGKQHQFWDGAVGGNNNPVLVGITEALAVFPECGRNSDDLIVLSIGTGNNLLPVDGFTVTSNAERKGLVKEIDDAKFTRDIQKMAKSILSEPPDAANYMAHIFLGGKPSPSSEPKIVRMNPLLQPVLNTNNEKWIIPEGLTVKEKDYFMELIELEMDAVKQEDVLKIEQLANWWIEDIAVNQSIRVESSTLNCAIGFPLFSTAKDEWLKRSMKKPLVINGVPINTSSTVDV